MFTIKLTLRDSPLGACRIQRMVISASLILGILIVQAIAQKANELIDLYGGIELSPEGVKAIALRASRNDEGPGLKLIYSEVIHLALGRSGNGQFVPQATEKAARAIQQLQARLRQQKVPTERIYLIGSSGVQAEFPEDLEGTISKITGKTLTLLDAETEVQLSIAGTIPQREQIGNTWIDNRNSSVLINIGNYNTTGGYQLLRYIPSAQYDFVTMNIPYGTISFTNEIQRVAGDNATWASLVESARAADSAPIREALRKERDSKPGLVNRKRVYVTGGITWAMVTLLNPDDRQMFVAITPKEITQFATRAARNPQTLLKPNLSYIRDSELRQDAEREVEAVRNTFSPQQIVAGAELLKAIAEDLNWRERKVLFARFGHYSCILSYVRLQTEK
jgi:hypothetical protein